MGSRFTVEQYRESMRSEWDGFVMRESVNGTFLQTRRFLSYHPEDRFEDCSLVVRKGNSIVAVVPACRRLENGCKSFVSHAGSTFGGVVADRRVLPAVKAIEVVRLLDGWLLENGFASASLKQTPSFFAEEDTASLEYALQHEGYHPYGELSFVADLSKYDMEVETNFTSSRRRDCRYGQKAGCSFRELDDDHDVKVFYSILEKSLEKFGATPVHTLAELLDFKNERLSEEVRFFGVEYAGKLVAGSMVFLFANRVFHTQYLAALPDYLDVFPMNYLDWNLIRTAKEQGYPKFSFGISTEEHGRELNESLATFKEGFGGSHSMNWTYTKTFGGDR